MMHDVHTDGVPNQTPALPALLSVKEAAQYLWISERTMNRYLDGKLKSCEVRVGKRRYVHADRLAEAMNADAA